MISNWKFVNSFILEYDINEQIVNYLVPEIWQLG